MRPSEELDGSKVSLWLAMFRQSILCSSPSIGRIPRCWDSWHNITHRQTSVCIELSNTQTGLFEGRLAKSTFEVKTKEIHSYVASLGSIVLCLDCMELQCCLKAQLLPYGKAWIDRTWGSKVTWLVVTAAALSQLYTTHFQLCRRTLIWPDHQKWLKHQNPVSTS